jgi:hypothetical protein
MNEQQPIVRARRVLWLLVTAVGTTACQQITTPMEHFGHNIGDDYWLPNYTPIVEYWETLDRESERLRLVDIGESVEGRRIVMAIVTSPQNQRKLDHYQDISRRLALAEGLTDEDARELAMEGRAVVWIDGGLHANETVGAQNLIELAYQMVSLDDAETLRILDNVILLAAFTNPDGMDMVVDWYMREPDPTKRFMGGFPRLEQYYIGHRNNRDFFINSQPETEAVSRVLCREWFPQIVYNHHHHGPPGAVIATPPFRDPFNYNIDPLVVMGIELVGAAINGRLIAENKPGATWRSGTNYQTWWNGGLRTTPYFHNQIGILTETSGDPTPIQIPFNPAIQLPRNDHPYPIPPYIEPNLWHFRQSVEYALSADRAVLDLAAKHREDFLFNIYQMGRNSIERGSRDHVTITPPRIAAVDSAIAADGALPIVRGEERIRGYEKKYYDILHDSAHRDARGYIIPSSQPDFLTATKFVNALLKSGVTVYLATEAFEVAGTLYPEGSYVVKAAQAFRPHVRDMMEPQYYPDDIPYPGGPPNRPYDLVGYTLAYQMGIEFDRVFDGFDGPFEEIRDFAGVPDGEITGTGSAGFLLSHEANDAFVAINRLLASGESVFWMTGPVEAGEASFGTGAVYVAGGESTEPKLEVLTSEVGLNFTAVESAPTGEALQLSPVRIGLWDQYGGSPNSGYVRWILEQFEFPVDLVYPQRLDAGNLAEDYDVLIFPEGAIGATRAVQTGSSRTDSPDSLNVPPEWRDKMGSVTERKTVPQLRRFLQGGGTVIAIGASTALGNFLGLPVRDHLSLGGSRIPPERFFVPGSIVEARVDRAHPLAWGISSEMVDVFFNNSPVFRFSPGAGLRRLLWFEGEAPLRSGWAWGQRYLNGGTAAFAASIGVGRLVLFGFDVTNRAQSHGTYKFLFNSIYYSGTERVIF